MYAHRMLYWLVLFNAIYELRVIIIDTSRGEMSSLSRLTASLSHVWEGLSASRWCLHHCRYWYQNKRITDFVTCKMTVWTVATKDGIWKPNRICVQYEQKDEIPHMCSAEGTLASEFLFEQSIQPDVCLNGQNNWHSQHQCEQNVLIWIRMLETCLNGQSHLCVK